MITKDNPGIYEGEPVEQLDEPELVTGNLRNAFYCYHCGSEVPYPIPVEPLYFIQDFYKMIPFPSIDACLKWLQRHAEHFPKRYLKVYRQGRSGYRYRRVLTASEVRKLREQRLAKLLGYPGLAKELRRHGPSDDVPSPPKEINDGEV